MKRITNRRAHGGIGFPRMGQEPFDLSPGQSCEISDERWSILSSSLGVLQFVMDGDLEVADVTPPVVAAPPASPPVPRPPPARFRRRST